MHLSPRRKLNSQMEPLGDKENPRQHPLGETSSFHHRHFGTMVQIWIILALEMCLVMTCFLAVFINTELLLK